MAGQAQYEELMRQFSAFGAVKREMGRILPSDCPSGSAAVLTLLARHGDMRMSKLSELLAVDMSVTEAGTRRISPSAAGSGAPRPGGQARPHPASHPDGAGPARRAVGADLPDARRAAQ